jgi:hypothetical protein
MISLQRTSRFTMDSNKPLNVLPTASLLACNKPLPPLAQRKCSLRATLSVCTPSLSDVAVIHRISLHAGAAIATLDAMMLKQELDPSVQIQTTVFGLPRVGNQAWADFVDNGVRCFLTPLLRNYALTLYLHSLAARQHPAIRYKPERSCPDRPSYIPRLCSPPR